MGCKKFPFFIINDFLCKNMVFTLVFFSCGKFFLKFFFFLSCSKHFKDHITMKIELCALSEFFEFDLEKKKNQILKKKKKTLKISFRAKKRQKYFLSVRCQDFDFFSNFEKKNLRRVSYGDRGNVIGPM